MSKYYVDTVALRKLMVEKGYLTISALANDANVNRSTLGKVLDGSLRPSTDVMDKLADTLEMAPEEAGHVFYAINLRNA